jgi:predicted transcriptional regulator
MKKKLPLTSLEAHASMIGEPISLHHAKIIAALDELGNAIYERIAIHIGWDDKNRCSRRLKELELLGIVEKTGETSITSSGRRANIYRLKPPPKPKETPATYVQNSLFS